MIPKSAWNTWKKERESERMSKRNEREGKCGCATYITTIKNMHEEKKGKKKGEKKR